MGGYKLRNTPKIRNTIMIAIPESSIETLQIVTRFMTLSVSPDLFGGPFSIRAAGS